ncbi:MAG: hypothetical protein AAFQ12_01210 [Pseudomonadota bacterium]
MAHSSAVRIITLAALAIGTSLFAQAQDSIIHEDLPVEADDTAITGGKTCYVSKVRFENKGAYALYWFAVDDYVLSKNMLSQGQSHTWQLDKTGLEEGETFWLRYEIDQGFGFKKKNCKKDGTTLKYHPDGNTWNHWSKGTTKTNNRCRYRNSNKCITSVD